MTALARDLAPAEPLIPAISSRRHTASPTGELPRVVIVGAGFGGLSAAMALRRAPVQVTVIDRRNHHLFQPLLYQVATAGLSPADIAQPIRSILRRQRNATVLLGRVTGVDRAARDPPVVLIELQDGAPDLASGQALGQGIGHIGAAGA